MRQSIGIAAIVTSLLRLAVVEVLVGYNSGVVVETVPISHPEGVRGGNTSACRENPSEPAGVRQGRRRSATSQGWWAAADGRPQHPRDCLWSRWRSRPGAPGRAPYRRAPQGVKAMDDSYFAEQMMREARGS